MNTNIRYAFFGSSRLSAIVLDEMKKRGFVPTVVVTTPDKPQGRKLILTPNVVKTWATQNGVKVFDFAKLDQEASKKLAAEKCDVFIVASYGKIIPGHVLELPPHKTLNIHPSLLPKYRGASPLPTAMLDDEKQTGVSIMRIDEEMDHGPIAAQKEITVNEWPTYEDFEDMMAKEGAQLLASILPDWVSGKIQERDQDHSKATYTRKYLKEDGLLDLGTDPYLNFRKIQAFHEWPQAYFFVEKHGKKIRVKVTSATYSSGKLTIQKVIPEGSREMSYKDFQTGYLK